MQSHTCQIILAALAGDPSVSTDERFWLGEIVEGRLPLKGAPDNRPNVTQKAAAAEIGVSDVTFAGILKELPYDDLPEELWPQRVTTGTSTVRIPAALIDHLKHKRGVR